MKRSILLAAAVAAVAGCINGQGIPVEIMAGHKRAGVDIMWFRKFSSVKSKQSPWLLFSRTRASADYHNTTAFGVTTALSYNFANGTGLVATVQYTAAGTVVKGGLQFYKTKKNTTVFTWLVAGQNTTHHFSADWFFLSRFTPAAGRNNKLFLQAELLSQTDSKGIVNLTQRARAGLWINNWQFGLAADINESGKTKLAVTHNHGLFLRREF